MKSVITKENLNGRCWIWSFCLRQKFEIALREYENILEAVLMKEKVAQIYGSLNGSALY